MTFSIMGLSVTLSIAALRIMTLSMTPLSKKAHNTITHRIKCLIATLNIATLSTITKIFMLSTIIHSGVVLNVKIPNVVAS
jgi:hypothetical protein